MSANPSELHSTPYTQVRILLPLAQFIFAFTHPGLSLYLKNILFFWEYPPACTSSLEKPTYDTQTLHPTIIYPTSSHELGAFYHLPVIIINLFLPFCLFLWTKTMARPTHLYLSCDFKSSLPGRSISLTSFIICFINNFLSEESLSLSLITWKPLQ